MCHKNRLFNLHFKVLINQNMIKLKFRQISHSFNKQILRNRLLCTIDFLAEMFVCIIKTRAIARVTADHPQHCV